MSAPLADFGWGNASTSSWSVLPDLPLGADELARRRLANYYEATAIDVHRLTLDWPWLRYVPRPHGPQLEIAGLGLAVTQSASAAAWALAYHRRTWHGRAA